ncbi:YicC family protein [Anaerotignum lactatifermentans]|uniref:YicC family protein n=1 Tax=Anaerotignum lactatifermentans TaxID=160404 RepID=A0ABS2G6Q6_9FIRM|nr:YicC/YloC family endoribonuclease [Anaerotignum lactatifermentans]MBM6829725.1 YicC family protein [Anaerotignum lactatifermentans]MBM6877146.1 YicC family protein [Anaerotignum lactatifermentans]MBM6951384.1 YicC family protein [Anaerotignum lactatifermentans]
MSGNVRSMTGYGRGEHIAEDRKFVVEMKSVNHRYNDMTVKLPRSLASLEDKIKKRVMQDVFRGKTDIYISFETFSAEDVEVKLNEALAAAYAEKLRALEVLFGESCSDKVTLAAKFPDVITVEKTQKEEEVIWAALLPALEEAVGNFVSMRSAEGENLKNDILGKAARIERLVAEVKEYAPQVVVEYQEKLMGRLKELLDGVDVDPQRVATEVAIFADRGCVDEEITRLESHLVQLREILEKGGQVGRKLDFLIQEMNRESNTIASKANDIRLVKATIELKSEIEKIREQIQNLE